MSDLANLLEVLHGAHDQLTSLEIEYRDWSRARPTYALNAGRSHDGTVQLDWQGPGPEPKEITFERTYWLEFPARLRVEVRRDHKLVRLGVRDGAAWWRWNRAEGASTGEIALDPQGVVRVPPLLSPPLLNPVSLLPVFRFESCCVTDRAGRKILRVRARPREQPPSGASFSYEFDFDAEHGTVLRSSVLDHVGCVQTSDAVLVCYDVPIDSGRFAFDEPDGNPATRVPRSAPTRVA
jgi:hypothetical protein